MFRHQTLSDLKIQVSGQSYDLTMKLSDSLSVALEKIILSLGT